LKALAGLFRIVRLIVISLIFTEQQTYTMKYVGLPAVWQVLPLDTSIGIMSPMARVSVNGIAYWMGRNNFYTFRGGKIEVMPSSFTNQSTIRNYVFTNYNYAQRSKPFAWYNGEWDEIRVPLRISVVE